MNLSAGAGENLEPGKEKMLIEAVEHLWDLGLVVVVSSGNNGPGEGTIAIPGNSRKVITVGAVKTEKAEKGSCSGAGPTKECVVKPDVIAPGTRSFPATVRYTERKMRIRIKSGSSMAIPSRVRCCCFIDGKISEDYQCRGEIKTQGDSAYIYPEQANRGGE